MVGVVESWRHRDVGWLRGGVNSGFACALGDVAGLTEIQAVVFFDDMNAEEGLQIVGLGDRVSLFQDVA